MTDTTDWKAEAEQMTAERDAAQAELAQARDELAAERERRARLRSLLQGAETLFAPLCRDATAWNWLDEARAALAALDQAREVLADCAETLEGYARHHAERGPEHAHKVARNAELAARCRAALAAKGE